MRTDEANGLSPVEQHNRRLMETVGRVRQVQCALEIIQAKLVDGKSGADAAAEADPIGLEGMAPLDSADIAMNRINALIDDMATGPIEALSRLIGHSRLVSPLDELTAPGDQWRPDRNAPSTRGPLQQGRDFAAEQKAARIKAEIAAKQETAAAAGEDGALHFHTRERGGGYSKAQIDDLIQRAYERGVAASQTTKPELPTDHPAMKKARSLAEISREFEKLAGRQITDTELRMVADWLTDRLENAK